MQELDLERISQKLKQDQLSKDAPAIDINDLINDKYPLDPFEVLGENDFGSPRQVPVEEVGSPIQEFFRDGTVLITGGTGFMGKTLTEKLIRSCPHLKRIYLLVRPKRSKDPRDRLEEIFEERVFLRLKSEVPDFRSKVSVVSGDIGLADLGLSPSERSLLTESVTVVFHGAATVKFDENIKTALCINVRGVQAMLELAKQMKHLKSFVHVSTAFSHCPRKVIDEVFYSTPYDYKSLSDIILTRSGGNWDEFARILVNEWPNTYTFTKAVAEDVVQREAGDLPIAVARPSVIVCTYKEPVRAWMDNLYGPVGVMVGAGTGVLHCGYSNREKVIDMMPIDVVVNTLLAIAWYRGSSNHQSVPIYNIASSPQNPIKWSEFTKKSKKALHLWPTLQALWYIFTVETQYQMLYLLLNTFLHVIPGYILDGILILRGQKPVLTQIYKKLNKASFTLAYFALRQWEWRNKNVQHLWTQLGPADRSLFFFDVSQINWDYFCEAVTLGLRVNLIKDGLHTLPAARVKWQRLKIAHYVLCSFFFTVVACLLYFVSRALYTCLPLHLVLSLVLAVPFVLINATKVNNVPVRSGEVASKRVAPKKIS